jgi:hypothetical protein
MPRPLISHKNQHRRTRENRLVFFLTGYFLKILLFLSILYNKGYELVKLGRINLSFEFSFLMLFFLSFFIS